MKTKELLLALLALMFANLAQAKEVTATMRVSVRVLATVKNTPITPVVITTPTTQTTHY